MGNVTIFDKQLIWYTMCTNSILDEFCNLILFSVARINTGSSYMCRFDCYFILHFRLLNLFSKNFDITYIMHSLSGKVEYGETIRSSRPILFI